MSDTNPEHQRQPGHEGLSPWHGDEHIGDISEAETPEADLSEQLRRESEAPRIWVGSLADYNNGVLHGQWMDAARPAEEIHADIQAMLARSRQPDAEEWGIFDYENFGSLRLGEYELIEVVSRVALGVAEHGPAFASWAELHDAEADMLESFQEAYIGAFESREAWAQTIIDDFDVEKHLSKDLPAIIAGHVTIDLAGIAHDLDVSGDVWIEDNPDGGIWVFRIE